MSFHSHDIKYTAPGFVQAEISHYKGTPVISLRDKPLQWWSLNKHILPNLAKMAQKYLGIVATSVPSERLFSVRAMLWEQLYYLQMWKKLFSPKVSFLF